MRLNRAQHIFALAPYYMATDKIILSNQQIDPSVFNTNKQNPHDFSDYFGIHKFLLQHKTQNQHILIYDITHNPQYPHNTKIFINDHINRIGDNPFIGQQNFFNVDFINIENLYTQHSNGIITTCYGKRYDSKNTLVQFPSTHMANIATLAHINQYTITGILINQL